MVKYKYENNFPSFICEEGYSETDFVIGEGYKGEHNILFTFCG